MAASKRKRRKGLKADYKDATPEQVAKAVLMYRPPPDLDSDSHPVNPSI